MTSLISAPKENVEENSPMWLIGIKLTSYWWLIKKIWRHFSFTTKNNIIKVDWCYATTLLVLLPGWESGTVVNTTSIEYKKCSSLKEKDVFQMLVNAVEWFCSDFMLKFLEEEKLWKLETSKNEETRKLNMQATEYREQLWNRFNYCWRYFML